MRQYASVFRIKFVNGLQYRAAAYAGIATQFAWGFMTILMFRAFYETGTENAAAFPMEFRQLCTYIWLQQAFLALFASWYFESDIFSAITSGNIAYELARPADLYSLWYVRSLALRASRALLRCAPILVVAAVLPEPYRFQLPPDIPTFLLAVFSMMLGCLLATAISMFVYIGTIKTLSPSGMRIILLSFEELLAGGLIPLAFFPDRVRAVVELLPFASVKNTAFMIFTGQLSGGETAWNLLLQVFWLAALLALGRLWMARNMRRIMVQGG